jgi:hypothetical protein
MYLLSRAAVSQLGRVAPRVTTAPPSRSIVTYETPALRARVESTLGQHPESREILSELQRSEKTYTYKEGPASYQYESRTITVRPVGHHQAAESVFHESFHARHDEHVNKLINNGTHDESARDTIFRSNNVHRATAEAGAHHFAKRMTNPDGTSRGWFSALAGYKLPPLQTATLRASYHAPVRKELGEEVVKNPTREFPKLP